MPRAEMLRQRAPKKTHCMPTHLADEEALHVAQEVYERGWSHSQYSCRGCPHAGADACCGGAA